PYETFDPGAIEVTEEELETYYRNNSMVYETPERRSGYLVRFIVEDFLGEDEADEQTLQQYFERNLQRYMTTEETALPDFASVKEQVLRDYRKSVATHNTVAAANEFVEFLYNEKTLPAQDSLTEVVLQHHGKIQSLPLFASGETVEGVDLLSYELMGMFSMG